jgi:hypothetical protein
MARATNRRAAAQLLAAVLVVAGGLVGVQAAPANAAALQNTTWSVSNNQASATGVTYTYSFKTAASGSIKTILMAVSGSGLAGTPSIVKTYGIGAGAVSRTGQTITYTVTSAVNIQAGIPIYIELAGLTNDVAGSYTTDVTTRTSAPAIIDGPTTSNAVVMAATNTAVTVTIGKSLTFALDTTAFQLGMDPGLPALADQTQAVGLTVQTNANSGYTLTVRDAATGLQSSSSGTPVIPAASAGKASSAAWPGANAFGYTVTGTGATIDAAFSGTKYAGYTSGGEQIGQRTGPTGGTADTITITNRVAIDYSAATGDYTDTIYYTVTPNYS